VSVGSHKITSNAKTGCYTYRERLAGTSTTRSTGWTRLGVSPETSAIAPTQPSVPAHPHIGTGYTGTTSTSSSRLFGSVGRVVARMSTARVKVPGVHLDAKVTATGFKRSELAPPANVHAGGYWGAGAGFNQLTGTTVVFGHVSDKHDRPGAFGKLNRAKRGQKVITVSGGHRRVWTITHITTVKRSKLPRSIFTQTLNRRLVLVTCTGEIRHGKRFHYTHNRIITAVPTK
jgi:LPXTG-site transpeptidase (sortase) family protein